MRYICCRNIFVPLSECSCFACWRCASNGCRIKVLLGERRSITTRFLFYFSPSFSFQWWPEEWPEENHQKSGNRRWSSVAGLCVATCYIFLYWCTSWDARNGKAPKCYIIIKLLCSPQKLWKLSCKGVGSRKCFNLTSSPLQSRVYRSSSPACY